MSVCSIVAYQHEFCMVDLAECYDGSYEQRYTDAEIQNFNRQFRALRRGDDRRDIKVGRSYFCVDCLKKSPDWFVVPNEDWERFVEPELRGMVLCRTCYDKRRASKK